MTLFKANPTVVLEDGSGPVPNSKVESIGWKRNTGWSMVARVQGELDIYQARFATYTATWTDGLGSPARSTPDMVWPQREFTDTKATTQPGVTVLNLSDLTSEKMRMNNQSFSSFLASSSGAILTALATRAGITITGVTGSPLDFYVIEEDIKNAKLADALKRFLDVSACDYGVNEAGEIACRAWEDSEVSLTFDWSTRKHNLDTRSLFTGLRGGKRSSFNYAGTQSYMFNTDGFVNQALSPFLTAPAAPTPIIVPGAGSIAAVTFYNASDEWVAHYDLTLGSRPAPGGPQGGVGDQCTYFVVEVLPPTIATQLRTGVTVTGTPPGGLPAGVDPEFLYPAAGVSLGEWPVVGDLIEQLFVSQAYFVSRLPYIKSRVNAPADKLTLIGPLQSNSTVKLFARHTYKTREFKIDSIGWNFTNNQTTIELVRQTSEV